MSYEDIPSDPSLAPPVPEEPFALLGRWFDEAREKAGQRNPLAMSVSSADRAGRPSARMVLCRGFDPGVGFVVFYTNYQSRKARELEDRGRAAATFYWDALSRQVRLEGLILRSPASESDSYFAGRPRASQIAAWASAQSETIESREALLARLAEAEARFEGEVPRPQFWGGYRLYCDRIELWVGAEGRAHDRVAWTRDAALRNGAVATGAWSNARLQP